MGRPASKKFLAALQRSSRRDDPRTERPLGFNGFLVVVGYVDGREPFRLLGRVSADTGEDALPDPPLTIAEMQPVAFAAKMALAKVIRARRKAGTK